MNDLFRQLNPLNNGNSQASWLMNMLTSNKAGLANMVKNNPMFNQFVQNNQGKSVEQICRENNLDMNVVQMFLNR